jgi:signal transduction histidine kinase
MERSVLRGVAVFRWAAWLWMAAVLWLARAALEPGRGAIATGLVLAALGVTVWLTLLLRRDPGRLCAPTPVGVEVGVALTLQLADGFVYRVPHVFTGEQPLGVGWPLAAILTSGIAFGPIVGAATGILLAVGRAVTSVLHVEQVVPDAELWLGPLTAVQGLSLVTTAVLYAFAGGVGGYAMQLVRRAEHRITTAERELADAEAREAVARTLHDGVLQTLAVVERRADDPQLAQLARDQERDLRAYLFGTSQGAVGRGPLGDALRQVAGRAELAFGLRVEVLVPDDLPALGEAADSALVDAVGEALTNAGKHGDAERVVVYLEPSDDGVFCSVRDDGRGFDPATTPEGVGLGRSIRARVEEAGGSVEVDAAPGRGCEVRLTLLADGT